MVDWFEKDWAMVNCLYFGCIGGLGHRVHTPGGKQISESNLDNCPWSIGEMELLPPKGISQRQFEASYHTKNGWSAIAYWDRTVDPRMNSKSVFMVEGEFNFEQVVEIMCRKFPGVIHRTGTIPILSK
jgi:hypothetical protein